MHHLRRTLQLNNASLAKAVNAARPQGLCASRNHHVRPSRQAARRDEAGSILLPRLYREIKHILPNQQITQGGFP